MSSELNTFTNGTLLAGKTDSSVGGPTTLVYRSLASDPTRTQQGD